MKSNSGGNAPPYIGGETVARMQQIVVRGVVLRETETREADKILTVLTDECGKIPVIARGARRKGCKFAASTQPLVYSEWTLYEKGEWYYVNEASTLELFSGLRSNLDAMALGFYFAELLEAVTSPDLPATELLRHLLNGLYALSALPRPHPLVKAAFECRLLSLAGYEPLADSCAYCGNLDPEIPMMDVTHGVLRCGHCGVKEGGLSMSLCPDSLAALRHVIYGEPKRLYHFTLGRDALQRFSAMAEAFTLAQMERKFRTLDFYHEIQSVEPQEI